MLMDLSVLLPPLTRTCCIPSPSEGGYTKLLFSCSTSAAKQQSNPLSKHTGWTKESYSFTAPFKSLSISLQVYAATLEGDMVAHNSSTETGLRSKINEVSQSSGEDREKFEPSVEASKNSRKPRRYAPRVGKDIVVPVDALMPGAILTGKVTNIQSFGAFVDIGAFASGLIRVSNLIDGYAKSVEGIINVGDEVKVKVLSVNVPFNRIALKLIKEDGDLKAETLPLSFQQCEESSTPSVSPQMGSIANSVSSGVFVKDVVVSLDALAPGAILMGKVTNIQSFGAFVDIGASLSGLIHISNLTNGYVASVEDFVKVGDQVKVKVLSVDVNSRRICLKLIREDGDQMVEKPPPSSHSFQQHGKPSRPFLEKSSANVPGRPQKGELFTGSVAKIVSRGIFVTMKQGHEGFLPASEVLSSGGSVETRSYFKVGQPLPVRVLRTTKDRITLTMRKQEGTVDGTKSVIGSEEGRATSPFEIAFRRNKVLAKFLEERERLQNLSKDIVEDGSVIGSATGVQA